MNWRKHFLKVLERQETWPGERTGMGPSELWVMPCLVVTVLRVSSSMALGNLPWWCSQSLETGRWRNRPMRPPVAVVALSSVHFQPVSPWAQRIVLCFGTCFFGSPLQTHGALGSAEHSFQSSIEGSEGLAFFLSPPYPSGADQNNLLSKWVARQLL